ncbi:MAG: SpoIIE family protein phosphatase [Acidobacteriota bacterium]
MALKQSIRVEVRERTDASEVRRQAMQTARALGFGEEREGRVALLATELAGNLFKHAGGGEVLLRIVEEEASPGIELLGLDRGPGMKDVGGCLRDGFSTAGTPGTGLGAMRRLSDQFDLHTHPGKGTAVLLRVFRKRPPRAGSFQAGAVCLPVAEEPVGGDAWAVAVSGSRGRLIVVDGLGHGPLAAEAADAVLRAFWRGPFLDLEELFAFLHEASRHGRGAACSVGEMDLGAERIRFAGVGNVAGMVVHLDGEKRWMPRAGTLGAEKVRPGVQEVPWTPGTMLLLHSDGLTSRWSLDQYPGLTRRHPALQAGVLYRDWARGTDDVTVAALKADQEEDGP